MTTIGVIGLGYVGLPLAIEFGKKYPTVGFDLSEQKIAQYLACNDPTGEVSAQEFKASTKLECTCDAKQLAKADFVVVAVPTPVDDAHQPDFRPLIGASEFIGRNLKPGATIVFESTVYPGATEEICIPVIERSSGKKWKTDFFVGYSPERINPGDKDRTLTKITKIVAGDTPETLKRVYEIYGSIITAGVYAASSIKVAEAAKVGCGILYDYNITKTGDVMFHSGAIPGETRWNKVLGDDFFREIAGAFAKTDAALQLLKDQKSIRESWAGLLGPNTAVSWRVSKVEVAKSGEIGYLYGTYQLSIKDPKGGPVINDTGKLLEVWKKQSDGKWKCIVDTYNSDLPVPAIPEGKK